MVGVLLHSTTSIEDLIFVLNHGELKCLVTNMKIVINLLSYLEKKFSQELEMKIIDQTCFLKSLQYIIVMDSASEELDKELIDSINKFPRDLTFKIFTFQHVSSLGDKKYFDFELENHNPDSLLNISYTSGSTGTPKGILKINSNNIKKKINNY
jgi:long-subunit acyl-CoA synthetase (AMP-forming)